MNYDEARDFLHNNGFAIKEEKDLNGGQGVSFRCNTGEILNVYASGKVVPQGKNSETLKKLLGQPTSGQPNAASKADTNGNRGIFVVYGHDSSARTELEAMLRRWGLQPKILDQITSGGQTIIEKLESAISDVSFAVVLATPDDEGHRSGHSEEKAYRARQNVVLELGMMLTKLGRDKVAILLKDQTDMERPSDIQGLIYIPFKDDVNDAA